MTTQLLTEQTVGEYLASRQDVASLIDASTVVATEVGDGNLNLVFVARDARERSLVIKQTLPYVRGDHSWSVTEDSIFAEARGLEAASAHTDGLSAAYYGLDAERRLVLMEDLSSWRVWRGALNDGVVSPGAGAAIGVLTGSLSFATSVLGAQPETVLPALAGAVNPELWRITEDLVFTEPYFEHPHNSWSPAANDLVLALRDDALRTRLAILKFAFLTRAESLLHGDLHTGSIFVPGPSVAGSAGIPAAKAFDFEFGGYGPVAFDLGMFFGNIVIAQVRAQVLGRDPGFRGWLSGLYAETWTAFEDRVRAQWGSHIDPLHTEEFREQWLSQSWHLAVGYAGAEAIRRTIGWAKVSDLTTLTDDQRGEAERQTLRAARTLIEEAGGVAGPDDLGGVVEAAQS